MADKEGSGLLSEEQGQALVRLARKTIMEKLKLPLMPPAEAPLADYWQAPVFQEKRGVFVTLHRAGLLRGCIGSLTGAPPIIEGVRDNAINAAFNDCRFSLVTAEEFAEIDVEVSILSKPQPLSYDGADDLLAGLRPGIDGVIIKKGRVSATFLPQVWKQLPETEGFLAHLCQKAGLPADEWRRGELEVITYQVQCFAEEGRVSA
ncbi:MAG: AmmeMemoRadiSam system protein A [Thermodesulfobacteriota bacterium]